MMQAANIGAADVHAGALAYRLQPFENLDLAGAVGVLLHACLVALRYRHNGCLCLLVMRSRPVIVGCRACICASKSAFVVTAGMAAHDATCGFTQARSTHSARARDTGMPRWSCR